ncbi:putative methyltransferase [Candidatus Planktophila dulcis]|uniref:Methyltransferase n=1 Tax=Candidatus Planktophila dulcis TaxID=1884914 RepID=A0AAC9YWG0_9ACTN|nr:class I SAM-dependent methyltransferase [Candidatus Planktophila dulcis]ASY12539.1 putative methyltransferase [Candidatus Planktophila dulcis]
MISSRTLIYSIVNRVFRHEESIAIAGEQKVLFTSLNLNRDLGLSRLNDLCKEMFGREYSEHNGMWSEHLVFLSALSISNVPIKRILEIGTFKGETTSIISKLFPSSEIVSVDLSHEEIRNNGTYSYAISEIQDQTQRRALGDVEFLELNSVNLLGFEKTFDLIWVDGYHLAPTVIIDIANSVRMLRKGGIALCDDVYFEKSWLERDSDLSSKQVLDLLTDCGMISQKFIYKRLGKKFNNRIVRSKMLGVAIKN